MGYLVDKVYEVLIWVLICKQKDLVWGCKEGKERIFLGFVRTIDLNSNISPKKKKTKKREMRRTF